MPRPPVSLTSLVGRERELRDLGALVAAQRLVTVTGVGGSGKTRLAAELALRRDWQRIDSVAWVELASCEGQSVVHQVAAALSLRDSTALVDALRERDLLLVLDNCEHVVGPAAELASMLLAHCPQLRILATSREPLGVAGERVWPVPPIAESEAIELFVERAAAVDPSFALTDDNRPAVAEICRRLDGIPLAIELAAARVRVLTPEQMTARLADRFAILSGGARTAISRHRTLRAAIDWSYALLSESEQQLLAELSVFAGSFALEAVEAIRGGEVLDLLSGLVDKSLVVASSRRGAVRYSLLETIREYAAEHLQKREEVRRAHALAYLAMARDAADDLAVANVARLDALDPDHDNIRAALTWSLEHEPDAIALPLAAAFRWYWYYRIQWDEGLRWLTPALERSSHALTRERAATLTGAGTLAGYRGDLVTSRARLEEAEAMWRVLGDERNLALTLSALAQTLANANELDAASARATEAVQLARAAGSDWDLGYVLTNAAAFVAQRRGELAEADRALEEAEAIWSPSKHPLGLPFVLNARAALALRRRDHAAAERFARAALVETRQRSEVWFSARSLRILAFTSTDDLPRAARLLGAADALLRTIGARMLLHETGEHERLMARLRQSMDAGTLDAALHEGSAMCFEAVCDLALSQHDLPAELLHVSDLGPLQITLGGKPLVNEGRASQRARELLVFLLAHPPGPTKEEVGVAFWPDATTEQVKNSFHVTLHRLRKLLGTSDAVIAEGARYVVNLPHLAQSQRFESAMTAALRTNDATALENALALYAGDFLQGEDAGEWCLPIRSRLRQLQLRGLFALGQAHESRGRYTDAAEMYTRLLAREPFHEPAARQLMICHSRRGARSESLLVYRQLEQRLREDLEATPEPETATLYRRLRQNEGV
ncbi:MAG TPA: BTAD domain-containing putative transcriptional regulator [Thermoanaerobaculia bacterium]|jgi:non-specific serine/threonine protein kinase